MKIYLRKFNLILVLLVSMINIAFSAEKSRVIHTTDMGGDDRNTLIRLFLFANDQKILGITTSASPWCGANTIPDILAKIDLYTQVYDNLKLHDSAYPTPDYLRSVTVPGNEVYNDYSTDTEGSMLIANNLLDHSDDSPIWVTCWGGSATVTAALRYINDHYPAEKEYVANKLKILFIAMKTQDETATCNAYIVSNYNPAPVMLDVKKFAYTCYWGDEDYWSENYIYSTEEWTIANYSQDHGPLCSTFVFSNGYNGEADGDAASILHLLSGYYGLRSTENPAYGGWGTRFKKDIDPTYKTYDDEVRDLYVGSYNQQYCYSGARWADAFQNELAVRADWCMKGYADANHSPVVSLNIPDDLSVKSGDTVNLSANATDPDGDDLTYHWWQYKEAGTSTTTVTITGADTPNASFICPSDTLGTTIHLILAVTDNGKGAPLTRYARVIVTISDTTTTPTVADSSKPLVKIVTIGDSITELKDGHNSYRYWLWNMLKVNGYNIDFVGSHSGVYDGTPKYSNFDQDNEGHWGWRTDEVRDNLPTYLQGYTPDIALIHLGHNDLIQDQSIESTISEIEDIVDLLRQSNPNVKILLAKIIPSYATWYPGLDNIPEFNNQLQTVVNDKNTANSPVILVDQNSGINPYSDLFDGIHPNEIGEVKMADKWYETLKTVLSGETPALTDLLLEAEDVGAININGAAVASNQAGFSGTGFVDYIDAEGAYVEWNVDLQSAGDYSIQFGYALSSGDRPLSISVNGIVVEPALSFPATGSFTSWSETTALTITLNAGINTIRATSIGSSGANVDYLRLIPISNATILEAEDVGAININGAVVATNQAGFSGTGFVDYIDAEGAYVEWNVDLQSAGDYSIQFGYALSSGDRPLSISINGTVVQPELSFPATGSFTSWSETVAFAVTLNAGVNTIRATSIGASGANVDYLKLVPLTEQILLEAEDATDISGAVVASYQPGFSGTGYVDYVNTSNDYIEWEIDLTDGGVYNLLFGYALASGDRPLQISVNGTDVYSSLSFPATGSWSSWSETAAISITLNPGINVIRATVINSSGGNIDYLKLIK